MKTETRNKGMTAIFTTALVAALFVGGLGGYAVAKASDNGSAAATTIETTLPTRASRWDHEELTAGTTIQRASRWDHEER